MNVTSLIASISLAFVTAYASSAHGQTAHACPEGEAWSVAHGPFARPSGHCCPEGTVWRVAMCPDSGGPTMVCARGPLRCGGGAGPQRTSMGNWQHHPRTPAGDSPTHTMMRVSVLDPLADEELDAILGDLVQIVRRPLQACLESAGGERQRTHWVAHYRMTGSHLRLTALRRASAGVRACFESVATAYFAGGAANGPFALDVSIEEHPSPSASSVPAPNRAD